MGYYSFMIFRILNLQILKSLSDCSVIWIFLWHQFFQLLHMLSSLLEFFFSCILQFYLISNFELDFSHIPSCLMVLKTPLPSPQCTTMSYTGILGGLSSVGNTENPVIEPAGTSAQFLIISSLAPSDHIGFITE